MKKWQGVAWRRNMKGWLFTLPWTLGFCAFFAYPLAQSALYGFSNIRLTAAGRKISPVGWDNYAYIFQRDIYFMERLRDFFVNTLFSLPVLLVFSLMIAMMINQKIKCKGLFRALFFLPVVVVSGPVLNMIISEGAASIPIIEQYGIYGLIENFVPSMIAAPLTYLFSQLVMILWYSGVPILIFLAGLQKIDRSLYEAALIDGASAWVAFWKITLPAMRGMIVINAVYCIVFLASSEINEVIALIRSAMLDPNIGYGIASAMAWVYSLSVALAIGLAWFLLGRAPKERATHAVILLQRRGLDAIRR